MIAKFTFYSCILILFIYNQSATAQKPMIHLDASVEASVNTDTNNVVTSWKDLSGNEYHASKLDGNAIYPSSKTFDNGMNAIDMRDSRISLELLSSKESDIILNQAANPTGFSIITTVYIGSIVNNWNDLLGNTSGVANEFFLRYSAEGILQATLAGTPSNGSKTIQPKQAAIFTFDYDAVQGIYSFWCSATLEEFVANVPPADFSNNNPLSIGSTTGATRFFDGMVGEIQIFNSNLSKEKRTEIVYELGDKWGVDLPITPLAPKTRMVKTKYSNSDVAIISYNAAEAPYNADKTGVKDATGAIQRALDDCATAPGGVVYLPEGTYRIDGNLKLEDGVILRGDWKQPTADDKAVAGTILNIYGGKGNDSDEFTVTSPIHLGNSSGIRDLNIYYPEQDASNPVPYPYAVRCEDKMQTVMNVTFVNAYKAIRFEPTNGSVGHPYVFNVYGYPLKKGIRLNHAAAVPRMDAVFFEPSYLTESGLTGALLEEDIMAVSRGLGSVAIEIAHSDNGIIGNLRVKGYDVAVQFMESSDYKISASNMKVYDFNISDCRIGINALGYKSQGWLFTKGTIQVDGVGAQAVSQTFEGLLTFNDVALSSTDKLVESSVGRLSFTNCRFDTWGADYAIKMAQGHLISYGNSFSQKLNAEQGHIYLANNVAAAAISANTFEESPAKIVSLNTDENKIVIDTIRVYDVYRHDYQSHPSAKYFIPARTDTIFNVKDYGAVGDMETDNTLAFQAALSAAKNNGGGTVCIPGGAYRIDGRLLVPGGVELRGTHDLPVYTGGGRTVLLNYVDEANPGDSAFISLEKGAAVRGFVIVRPQQKYNELDNSIGTTIHDWPYGIQALGDNCSVVNIAIANCDKGIDLSTPGGGHYVNWYMTATLGTCLNLEAGANPSVIDNMQTNTWLYYEIKNRMNWFVFTDNATLVNDIQRIAPNPKDEGEKLWPNGTAANITGDGEVTFYANFYNNPFNGYIINGSPKMVTILCGGEGENFYKVESEGTGGIELDIIANTYHPVGDDMSKAGFGYYQLNPGSTGTVKVLNTTSFGNPDIGYRINNGKLIIQSAFHTTLLKTFVEARGDAVVSVEGSYLYRGMSGYHATAFDSTASINMNGTFSENFYKVFGNVDASGSTPRYASNVDIINPTTPQNLKAEAISSNQINLSWQASTDNSMVEGYYVYRDGQKIATVNDISYNDTGLESNTLYSYYVIAFDDSMNESDTSNTSSATTLINTGLKGMDDLTYQVHVYPNPAKDMLNFELNKAISKPIKIEIYTINGQQSQVRHILINENNSALRIDVSDLKNGIYIYRLSGSKINATGRFEVKK